MKLCNDACLFGWMPLSASVVLRYVDVGVLPLIARLDGSDEFTSYKTLSTAKTPHPPRHVDSSTVLMEGETVFQGVLVPEKVFHAL